MQADWSPDGSRIVFERVFGGSTELWVVDADGANELRLTQLEGHDWLPAWSPNGERIAFSRYDHHAGQAEIYPAASPGKGS